MRTSRCRQRSGIFRPPSSDLRTRHAGLHRLNDSTHRRTRIKICGITRIADAHAAVDAGVDAVGLVFWTGTPRVVGIDQARAIVATLPPYVTVVALFVDPEPAAVRSVLASVPIDVLQFHGGEPAALCRAFGRRYVKAIPVKDDVDLVESMSPYDDAAGLLFDAFSEGDLPGGTGRAFDWGRLTGVVRSRLTRPLILSGGLSAANVGRAIRDVAPWAVDVSSGVEELDADGAPRRGFKDAARIRAFVQGVRSADGGALPVA